MKTVLLLSLIMAWANQSAFAGQAANAAAAPAASTSSGDPYAALRLYDGKGIC